MIHAINRLMQRLSETFALQRRFVADAAHELTTPITALRLQAQSLERAKGESARAAALAQLIAGSGSVLELLEKGAAGSWMLSDQGPRMVARTDVEVTSAIDIFVKDSGLVLSAGQSCGAELPLLSIADERLRRATEAGLVQRDDSRVIEPWER